MRKATGHQSLAKSICILEGVSFFQHSFISRHALLLLRAEGRRPEAHHKNLSHGSRDTDLIHIKGGCARTP
jgi:hypothetical protein